MLGSNGKYAFAISKPIKLSERLPSKCLLLFYFGIPFGVVFPSCQSLLILFFAFCLKGDLLTHLFATNRKQTYRSVIEVWG